MGILYFSILWIEKKKKEKKSMYLVTTLDVFHGNEFFGLFVPHEPSHPEIPSTYILHKLVLFHFFFSLFYQTQWL